MSFETPKVSSPEEKAQAQKERTLNDAKLLKNGAEYKIEDDGNLRLEVTNDQIEDARKEMNIDLEIKNFSEDERKYFEGQSKVFSMIMNTVYLENKGKLDPEKSKELREKTSMLNKNGLAKFSGKIDDEGFRKVNQIIWNQYDQKIKAELSEVRNFEELVDVVDKKAAFKGSQEYFYNDRLKDILNRVRDGKLELNYITNSLGLRDAVKRIMSTEKEKSFSSDEAKKEEIRKNIAEEGLPKENMQEEKEQIVAPNQHLEEIFTILNKERGMIGIYQAIMMTESAPRTRPGIYDKYGGFHPAVLQNFLTKYPSRAKFDLFVRKKFPNTGSEKRFDSINMYDLIRFADVVYGDKSEIPEGKPDNPEEPNKPDTPIVYEAYRASENELVSKGIDPRRSDINYAYVFNSISEDALIRRYGHLPKIGAENLATRSGVVNGRLIWCDCRIAIFETPQGKLVVPFDEIVSPGGKTYGRIRWEQKEKEERRRRIIQGDQQERMMKP